MVKSIKRKQLLGGNFKWYTIPAYNFVSGENTVKITLDPSSTTKNAD